jgi:hypothetical protein
VDTAAEAFGRNRTLGRNSIRYYLVEGFNFDDRRGSKARDRYQEDHILGIRGR